MPKEDFVVLQNARTEAQRRVMEGITECPFCPGNLPEGNRIIRRFNHWFLMHNMWPYKNTRFHILAVLIRHTENLDLQLYEWTELFQVLKWAQLEFKVDGGGIGIRFGDPTTNRATVRHLHAHLIVPEITDRSDPAYIPVVFYIA